MDTIAAILAGEQFASRRAVGRRVCEEFGFRERLGRLQVAICLKALNVLAERSERIVLPTPAAVVNGGGKPSLLASGTSLAESVPERLQGVEQLCVLRVGKRSQRQIWNTLIANEHRLGMTTFAGAQMRNLVRSAHGWLGALGFAAEALRLAARERWMGWSEDQRRAHLNRVVGMSRFLIRGGCGTQRLRFRTAVRLQRAIAIRSVIACRPMVLTLLGREVPELEAKLLITAQRSWTFSTTTPASMAFRPRTAWERPCGWWRTSGGIEAGSTTLQ